MNEKKERKEYVYFKTNGPVKKISVSYNQSTDELYLHQADVQSIRIEKSYERESGKDKVLGNLFTGNKKAKFGLDESLETNFDYAVCIDTNTKKYRNKKISITTCYAVPETLNSYDSEIPFLHLASYVIKNPSENVNPEQIGWNLIIEKHINKQYKSSRYVIFVDSEKDKLESINKGELEYFGDNFLPQNITLSYASDKDVDSFQGKMIKMCHNTANTIFNLVDKDQIINSNLDSSSCYHEGVCFIKSSKQNHGGIGA